MELLSLKRTSQQGYGFLHSYILLSSSSREHFPARIVSSAPSLIFIKFTRKDLPNKLIRGDNVHGRILASATRLPTSNLQHPYGGGCSFRRCSTIGRCSDDGRWQRFGSTTRSIGCRAGIHIDGRGRGRIEGDRHFQADRGARAHARLVRRWAPIATVR